MKSSAGATAPCGVNSPGSCELEYVLCYRTRRGNQREYQLLYDSSHTAAAQLAARPVFATRHLPTRVIRPKSPSNRRPSGTPPAVIRRGVKRG